MSLTIDSEKLTKLIMSLYNLIHVRIVVFDENFHEVFAIPRRYSAFCESINSIPEMRAACDHCAEMMCRKRQSDSRHMSYGSHGSCHANT